MGRPAKAARPKAAQVRAGTTAPKADTKPAGGAESREEKKKHEAEARRRQRAAQALQAKVVALETQIAETEAAMKALEEQMAQPGFYDDRASSQPVIDQHQALMWKVGDLMHQWEELQTQQDSGAAPSH